MLNRQTWAMTIVVLGITAGAALFLATQHSRQKLGSPGVRIEEAPLYSLEPGASTNPPVFVSSNRIYLPARVLDFASQEMPVSRLTVAALPKDTVFGHRVYAQSNGIQLDCQVVLMGADRSSIHKPQYCLVGSGFKWDAEALTAVRVLRPHPYDLPVIKMNLRREARDESGGTRTDAAVFVYWFVADGELTAQHSQRMWWMARDMLKTGVLQRWAYVILFAPCIPGTEDATFEGMKAFIADAVPQFHITHGPPLPTAHAVVH